METQDSVSPDNCPPGVSIWPGAFFNQFSQVMWVEH